MARNYYMVRGMDSSEAVFDELLKNEVVAVGWSDLNFTLFKENKATLVNELGKYYFNGEEISPQKRGRWETQSFRFCTIKKGDRIVVPYNNYIIFAEANGQQIYKPEAKRLDLANQQKVSFLRNNTNDIVKIPRVDLPDKMQRRLRVPGSIVTDFSDFKDIINMIFDNKTYKYKNIYEKNRQVKIEKFKSELLDNIKTGKTNIKAGGRGLEELVSQLLQIDGYDTHILDKRNGEGIADIDIKAEKIDHLLGEQKLFIQVKHHQGISSNYGLKQLEEARKQLNENYKDFQLVFLTTAKISESDINEAYEEDIICIDGQGFVDWLYDNLDKLPYETKTALHVAYIPQIVE